MERVLGGRHVTVYLVDSLLYVEQKWVEGVRVLRSTGHEIAAPQRTYHTTTENFE